MDKKSFFLKALLAPTKPYALKQWLLDIFTVVQENSETYKTDAYPYRVAQLTTGTFFVDPENGNELTKISDAVVGKPLFRPLEGIDLPNGVLVNAPNGAEGTTIGNVLFNLIALCYPFGDSVPYIKGHIDVGGQIEPFIASKLKGNPTGGAERQSDVIYVDQYMRFAKAMGFLTELNLAVTQALTPKSILPPPGIVAKKKELFEKYKDSLTDPSTIARIDAELNAYDAEYLKGDPSEKFLLSAKSRKVVRKRLFLMYGGESGLGDSNSMTLIKNSLSEGWDPAAYPVMNNTSRAGSFDRGSETQKGGEEVKWLLRASSNIRIIEKDCGTTLGKGFAVTDTNYKKIINLNVITTKGIYLVEDEPAAKALVGKNILVRSPMYCKHKLTDYCKTCVGERLSANPNAASSAITAEGSAFMLLSLKAAHGKAVALAKMNLEQAFS